VNIICQVLSTTGSGITTLTYTIFSGALTTSHTTYTQSPLCNFTPVVEITWSTDNSAFSAVSALTAWTLLYDQSGYTITTSDYSLHNQPYYIKQKTTYNGAHYDEYSFHVVFYDPCWGTAFIDQTVPDVVNFITVDSANVVPGVVTALPKLTDSTNEQFGTDPLNSICDTQTAQAYDTGVTAQYVSVSEDSTEFTVASATATDKGEHQVDWTYRLTRYTNITTTVSSKVTLFLLEDPNPEIEEQEYTVGTGAMSFSVMFFTLDPSSADITIVHTLEQSDGSAVPSFITLEENTGTSQCDIVV
jgi:hypothetical protein